MSTSIFGGGGSYGQRGGGCYISGVTGPDGKQYRLVPVEDTP